jgi:hypothetical protein
MSTTYLTHVVVSLTSEEDISLCPKINICLRQFLFFCYFPVLYTATLPVVLGSTFIMKGLSS